MTHVCYKMHGAGNDFLVADNRKNDFPVEPDFIRRLCCRNRGIGADGLLLVGLPDVADADLRMTVYNSDGSFAGMCGNGLRCAALFASRILDYGEKLRFQTDGGILNAVITETGEVTIDIELVHPFEQVEIEETTLYVGDTGVPHAVILIQSDLALYPVEEEGAHFRQSETFFPAGANVDFAEILEDGSIAVRTYERGVEGETEACGTGAAAVAACAYKFWGYADAVTIRTKGGDLLSVDPITSPMTLTGPATFIAKCEFYL